MEACNNFEFFQNSDSLFIRTSYTGNVKKWFYEHGTLFVTNIDDFDDFRQSELDLKRIKNISPTMRLPYLDILLEFGKERVSQYKELYNFLKPKIEITNFEALKYGLNKNSIYFIKKIICELTEEDEDKFIKTGEIDVTVAANFPSDRVFCYYLQKNKTDLEKVRNDALYWGRKLCVIDDWVLFSRLIEQGISFEYGFGDYKQLICSIYQNLGEVKFFFVAALIEASIPNELVKIIESYIPWVDKITFSKKEEFMLETLVRVKRIERKLGLL